MDALRQFKRWRVVVHARRVSRGDDRAFDVAHGPTGWHVKPTAGRAAPPPARRHGPRNQGPRAESSVRGFPRQNPQFPRPKHGIESPARAELGKNTAYPIPHAVIGEPELAGDVVVHF